MSTNQLPNDLNPEIVKATAVFIGQLTGLVPPPTNAFPQEWHDYLRAFTKRVSEAVGENAPVALAAPHFPTMLRKMWSGTELQRWLNENITALHSNTAQAPLTTEQREAIEWAAGRAHVMSLGKPVDGVEFRRWRVLSNLFSEATVAPAAAAPRLDDTLQFESVLAELINKIDSNLDSGDVLKDARRASAALDAILSKGDLVANAYDYFRDAPDRAEKSIDFRIGWDACLDAIIRARDAAPGMSDAARDVLAERARQVSREGWTPEHDDAHACGEIAAFAAVYAMPEGARDWPTEETGYGATLSEALTPDGWQPKFGDRRRDLVKAGALTLAEIERIDRAGKGHQHPIEGDHDGEH